MKSLRRNVLLVPHKAKAQQAAGVSREGRMRLFILTFFLVYGGIHLYAFLKARAAISFGPAAGVTLALFMLVMILAPVIVRYSERSGLDLFARIMAHVGFIWGAVLFLFFSASLVIDVLRLLVWLSGLILRKDLSALVPSSDLSFFAALAISVCIAVYGYFEARNIRTERIVVQTSKLPPGTDRLKIVQISDVHLGLIVREERLRRIINEVIRERPDILVSTGDLVDGQVCRLNGLSDILKEINPRYGKFAVTGNHEFYAGIENSVCFTELAGFTLLRGSGATVAGMINIAGVDDPAGNRFGPVAGTDERAVLSSLPREKFTLFLKHRPLLEKDSTALFDLQLSGHAHKGQIFPFTLIIKFYYPLEAGLAKLEGGSFLYVSRGSGTWGPPIRFLSPPEVTVIELVR